MAQEQRRRRHLVRRHLVHARGTIRAQAFPATVPVSWKIGAVGDFDGDSRSDVLWQNSDGQVGVWLMNGGSIRAQTFPLVVDSSWQARAVTDVDDNGTNEVVWHHTSGQVTVWFMSGGNIARQTYPGPPAASPWQLQGTLDNLIGF